MITDWPDESGEILRRSTKSQHVLLCSLPLRGACTLMNGYAVCAGPFSAQPRPPRSRTSNTTDGYSLGSKAATGHQYPEI